MKVHTHMQNLSMCKSNYNCNGNRKGKDGLKRYNKEEL